MVVGGGRSRGACYAMLDGLTESLVSVFKGMVGQKTISESNIDSALRYAEEMALAEGSRGFGERRKRGRGVVGCPVGGNARVLQGSREHRRPRQVWL